MVCGIVAEYNPFHNGHLYQLRYAKEVLGAEFIIVAMSGDYVQRGVPALLDKHTRARMALLCGADLVLELPLCVSTASAEGFAHGSISLLHSLGVVDHLCFGAETDRLDLLEEAACLSLLEPPAYAEVLRETQKKGLSFPAARALALAAVSPVLADAPGLLTSPNNILALEYLKALRRLNSPISPALLVRQGASYHQEDLSSDVLPSASALRKAFLDGAEEADLRAFLPKTLLPPLLACRQNGRYVLPEDLSSILLLKLWEETDLALLPPALRSRCLSLRSEFTGFLVFAKQIKTRDITLTAVQRALLKVVLCSTSSPYDCHYARVLGFRKEAAGLLRQIKEVSSVPLLSRMSDTVPGDEAGQRMLEETVRASNLYQGLLSCRTGQPALHEFQKQLVML